MAVFLPPQWLNAIIRFRLSRFLSIWLCLLSVMVVYAGDREWLDNVIGDVYEQLTEVGAVDYEELQEDLLDLAAHPINLNAAQAEDLERLRFLNNAQIDAILLYVYQHPMQSMAELQLINCLQDYDIRNLRAFAYVAPVEITGKLNPHEVFRYAKHEINSRIDVRNAETRCLCRHGISLTTGIGCSSVLTYAVRQEDKPPIWSMAVMFNSMIWGVCAQWWQGTTKPLSVRE